MQTNTNLPYPISGDGTPDARPVLSTNLGRPAVGEAPIGNTPLIRLRRVTAGLPEAVTVWAKAEHLNPGGSVKDRAAWRMVAEGRRSGRFQPGQTLLDATSGNTGIAYAMLGAAQGFPVTLAMPANASEPRKKILRAYGAELLLTDPLESTDGAQALVKEMVAADPGRYFYPDQYNNPGNWRAHFDGTGAEIIQQTAGGVTHFITALGTSGTFTGTTRRLKTFNPEIRCIALQPEGPMHGLEGVKHMETARVPGIYDPRLPDAIHPIRSEDAHAMAARLAREEGLFVGPSAAGNVAAALELARTLESGLVVTILCDTGARYLGAAE